MREDEFRNWLINCNSIEKSPISNAISRCKRIENSLDIDLDSEFNRDQLNNLIARLQYSAEDQRNNTPLPQGINIDGDKRNGMASLKDAIKKYKLFRENQGDVLPNTGDALQHITNGDTTRDTIECSVFTNNDLMQRFKSRLGTQSRYYPDIDLVFPPRFISKIFADTNSNPWKNWMEREISSMRFLKEDGSYVEFRNIEYIKILEDRTVEVYPPNSEPFKLYTDIYTNNIGGRRPLIAKKGPRDISIDHITSACEYY